MVNGGSLHCCGGSFFGVRIVVAESVQISVVNKNCYIFIDYVARYAQNVDPVACKPKN